MSGNEAAAVGTIRSVLAAENSYTAINGGFYDSLQCLTEPTRCLPTFSGPVFLDPLYRGSLTKGGYTFMFQPWQGVRLGTVNKRAVHPSMSMVLLPVAWQSCGIWRRSSVECGRI